LTVTDADSTTLTSATVRIVNPFDGASETLGVNTAGTSIGASYNPATGTLTLTGNPTTNLRNLDEYRQVLRTVTYQNTSTNPNTGTREVRFTLNDGVVDGPVATSSVTVGAVNNPPVNGLPASASTNEDTALVFSSGNNTQVSITDPDVGAGSISVKLTVEHGTLKLNGISGLTFTAGEDNSPTMTVTGTLAAVNTALNGMTFTPTANYYGSGEDAGSLHVETNDQQSGVPGGAKTDDDTVIITITSVNDLPTISDISDTSTNESTAVGPITFSVNDVETAAGSLTLTGSSNNQTLVPDAKITFGVSGGSRTVTVEPAAGQSGLATITVTVHDADGGAASDTFLLTVTGVNAQPTIAPIQNQTTAEDTPLGPLTLAIGDEETAAASLLLTGTSSDTSVVPNGGIVFGGSGATRTVTITPAANATGPTTITVTVHDANGGAASRSFPLTVTPVNDPPTIADIPDQATREGTAVGPLTISVNDVDNAAGSLTLTASSNNQALVPDANVVFGGSGGARTITVTPVAGQAGQAAIAVTVRDGQGGQASETFVVSVGSALAAGQMRLSPQTTLTPDQPTAVWLPGAPSEAMILIPAAVQHPILDLGALLGPCSADARSATLPTALNVRREGEGGTIIWRLPGPVTITGPCTWDG
jgi:VCBS repeat-containing protein